MLPYTRGSKIKKTMLGELHNFSKEDKEPSVLNFSIIKNSDNNVKIGRKDNAQKNSDRIPPFFPPHDVHNVIIRPSYVPPHTRITQNGSLVF